MENKTKGMIISLSIIFGIVGYGVMYFIQNEVAGSYDNMGMVTKVIDGSTIILDNGIKGDLKIKLVGIAIPESSNMGLEFSLQEMPRNSQKIIVWIKELYLI